MEICGRHDIFRAAGLLLSVHRIFFFFFRPQLPFYAGLALIRLLVSCWCFYICKLLSWCPACFAVLSQTAFFTRCYNISLQQTAPWGWAFDTNGNNNNNNKKSCCFAVTFLLSNNTSLPLFGCFTFVINPVEVRLVPQAVCWSVRPSVNWSSVKIVLDYKPASF